MLGVIYAPVSLRTRRVARGVQWRQSSEQRLGTSADTAETRTICVTLATKVIFLLHTPRIQHDSRSTFEFVIASTAAMELPGGIEDELGVALSYAIMLGGGAPRITQCGVGRRRPSSRRPGQSKKAPKEAKAKAKAEKGRRARRSAEEGGAGQARARAGRRGGGRRRLLG